MKANQKIKKTPTAYRRVFLLFSAILIMLASILLVKTAQQKRTNDLYRLDRSAKSVRTFSKPNVFLIIVDTLRADHLSLFNYKKKTSPVIDTLARDSVVFESAYTTAPWTLPSIASMLTGHHPYVLGIREECHPVEERIVTLTDLFVSNGYSTGAIISHIFLLPMYGLVQGFHFLDHEEHRGSAHISSPGVTDRAIRFAEKHLDQPLFMLLHYFDPHYFFVMHDSLNDFKDYDGPLYSNMPIRKLRKHSGKMTAGDLRYLNSMYDSEIRFTDYHMGRFLGWLKKKGIYKDSLIVFVADHGEELGDRHPGYWIGHTKVITEATMRIPLIIKLPKNKKTGTIYHNTSLVDLMPTIAQLSDLEIPPEVTIHGRALDLENPDSNRKVVFFETGRSNKQQGAISDNWKFIHNLQKNTHELYNLTTDPGGLVNIAQQNLQKVAFFQQELVNWNLQIEALRKRQPSSPKKEPTLTKDEEALLRALGYVE